MSELARPIKVGFVMHKMQVAGAEVLVKRMIDRLRVLVDATVFCLDGVGELGHELQSAGTPVLSFDRQPGFDMSIANRLSQETRDRGIDILHAHQYTPFFYAALSRIKSQWLHRSQVKIIFTEHGRHYPDVVSWKRRLANRFVLQHYADATTACCDFSTQALRDRDGFAKTWTLRNGVQLENSKRSEVESKLELRKQLGLIPGVPYVACVARFHPIKDHATLIRAWEKVQNQTPNARLLLVGDGPERKSIEEQAALAGLSQSVEFTGVRHDVAQILKAVDVFTLTSISEAASLTLMEAMAVGCPSVVTDVGGNAEHIRESIDGFLTPRSDSIALSKRLVDLIRDPDLRERLGAAAKERVSEQFSLRSSIDQYANLYRNLVNHPAPKAPHLYVPIRKSKLSV